MLLFGYRCFAYAMKLYTFIFGWNYGCLDWTLDTSANCLFLWFVQWKTIMESLSWLSIEMLHLRTLFLSLGKLYSRWEIINRKYILASPYIYHDDLIPLWNGHIIRKFSEFPYSLIKETDRKYLIAGANEDLENLFHKLRIEMFKPFNWPRNLICPLNTINALSNLWMRI